LPNVKKYEPTGTGESPLAEIKKWLKVTCPKCKKIAWRETNTMPQWAGSSWYWLRYADPKNKTKFADFKKLKYWQPVDVYFGGMEHTTLHLLYSRFWNLFLYDQGLVTVPEPYKKRHPHGIILGPDGEKMSKSRGNVVNPDDVVKSHGADTLRMYELFLGPHEATVSWNDKGVVGVKRFLDRIWDWVNEIADAPHSKIRNPKSETPKDTDKVQRALHKLIKKITEDIENFRFNTSISAFMEFHNEIKEEFITLESVKTFLILLYPFAPHISEELYQRIREIEKKKVSSLQLEAWPLFDEALTIDSTVEMVFQINGKVKGKLTVPAGSTQEAVQELVIATEVVKQALVGETIKRVIFVPNRLINLVI
jgi:leucyl-tRNA synthetase